MDEWTVVGSLKLPLYMQPPFGYAYLLSPGTSCKCGATPSGPLTGLLSSRDNACALAAAQDNRALQRRNHAVLALPRSGAGADRDLALATNLRNLRVSHDHLPPISAARTTSFSPHFQRVPGKYAPSVCVLQPRRLHL